MLSREDKMVLVAIDSKQCVVYALHVYANCQLSLATMLQLWIEERGEILAGKKNNNPW